MKVDERHAESVWVMGAGSVGCWLGGRLVAASARVCQQLGWLGVQLDAEANARHAAVISGADSRVRVGVEQTNEEWVAASQAARLLQIAP